jgi:outer membrane receptor for ferrienterochelin and colicins
MRKSIFILLIVICAPHISFSQGFIRGKVIESEKSNKEQSPMIGVNLHWSNTTTGTTTDVDGKFELKLPAKTPAKLVVSYVGYKNDTISISSPSESLILELESRVELKEFVVTAREDAVNISTISSINTTTLTRAHLEKAACCNLAESFDSDASVDVIVSDAVAGTKKIQMLGLDGIYSQIMFENMPFIRGLSSTYGMGYVPGTFIESIQVTKGSGSVVNGFESMSGQINLEYFKPETADKAFLNVYASNMARFELNGHYVQKLNERWSTMFLVHARTSLMQVDNNADSFMDGPIDNEIQVVNRWKYRSAKREGQFGIRLLTDDKLGGQIGFKKNNPEGNQDLFGYTLKTRLISGFAKNGFMFPNTPWKSIGLQTSLTYHDQDSQWGTRAYNATHSSAYFNGIYQSILGNTDHKFKTGISFQADDYQQQYIDSVFNRTEIIPGVFGEYTYAIPDKFSVVAGSRIDYHNLFGTFILPRLHLKYHFAPKTIARASIGKGFRSPLAIAENIGALASSRQVVMLEMPQAEVSWNTGVSLLQKFNIWGMEGYLNLDYYYTWFENQLIADYDFSARTLLFYNLRGASYSHSFQADFWLAITEQFEAKLAYKRYDVKTTYFSGDLLDRPYVPKDRALLNLAYRTKHDIWVFDFTTNWYGISRVPSTMENSVQNQRPDQSQSYFLLNAQITKDFKFAEVYVGGENLLNYKQPQPIIDAQNPFGSEFDASMVWGPIMGTVVYVGLRTTF